jgi:hypothetical protein
VSGDGDTRQVISSTTMDGSVSYLRFRTQGPLMTRPISRPTPQPLAFVMPNEIPMRVRNLDKPGAAQALADPTKSGSKKSPSHMSLTARDTPPRCWPRLAACRPVGNVDLVGCGQKGEQT